MIGQRKRVSSVVTAALLLATAGVGTAEAAPKKPPRKANVAAAPAPEPDPVAAPAPAAAPAERAPARGAAAARTDADRGVDEASDDEAMPPSGFALGARLGYALPMGSIAKDASLQGATDLSKTVAGMVPIWIDAGYRIDPHLYVGGYFQFGFGNTSGDLCNRLAGTGPCSSSANSLRFGLMARYTFRPETKIAPWIGVSTGYEILNVSATVNSVTSDATSKGFEFIGLHVGADFRVMPQLAVGPALTASFGQYSSYSESTPGKSTSADFNNTALHEWVFLGFRGEYDL